MQHGTVASPSPSDVVVIPDQALALAHVFATLHCLAFVVLLGIIDVGPG